jgi:hypothetical protein
MTITEDEPTENLRIGWGKWSVAAHGPTVVFLLGFCVLLVANFYLNDLRKAEHAALLRSHDLMTCVLTLSQEQRDEFRRTYRPGGESIWCPWLRSEYH